MIAMFVRQTFDQKIKHIEVFSEKQDLKSYCIGFAIGRTDPLKNPRPEYLY